MPRPGSKTDCDECGNKVTLEIVDADGVLVGVECPDCGYYVTRYMPGMEPR